MSTYDKLNLLGALVLVGGLFAYSCATRAERAEAAKNAMTLAQAIENNRVVPSDADCNGIADDFCSQRDLAHCCTEDGCSVVPVQQFAALGCDWVRK